MEKLSLILLTFGRKQEVADALQSIRTLSYPNREVLVVDNNPDENFLNEVRARFPEVSFLHQSRNLGAAGGRNAGLRSATGKYCAFVDDDVLLERPDSFETAVDFLEGDATLAGISFRILDDKGRALRDAIPRIDRKDLENPYLCAYFCSSACLFRVDALREVGGFWEELFIDSEELDLSYRLIDRGYRLLHVPAITARNRMSSNGRNVDRFVYYYSSNRFLVALRNLPVPQAVSTTVLWWAFLLKEAIRAGQVRSYLRGIARGLGMARLALNLRKPLDARAMDYVRSQRGRVYY